MNLGRFSRVLLGALLSAVLVVTVVTPVAADEVEPTPTLVDVPLLVSEPLEAPVSTTPEGDFSEVVPPVPTVIGKGKSPSCSGPSLRTGGGQTWATALPSWLSPRKSSASIL